MNKQQILYYHKSKPTLTGDPQGHEPYIYFNPKTEKYKMLTKNEAQILNIQLVQGEL